MVSQPTVFIIDSDAEHRRSLSEMLRSIGFVTAGFGSDEEYLSAFEPARSGCILVVARRAADGQALQKHLSGQPLAPPLIFVAAHQDLAAIVLAVRQGAWEIFQLQSLSETELWESLQRGFTEDSIRRERHAERQAGRERLTNLTDSEQRVLHLLVQGRNNHQIAKACGISRAAVEGRRARLMRKLGVTSLAKLVRLAVEAEFTTDCDGDGCEFDGAAEDDAEARDSDGDE